MKENQREKIQKLIEKYDKETGSERYELRWCFDFDPSLLSVCNINGENYNPHCLSEEEKEIIEDNYTYLKDMDHFVKHSGCLTPEQKADLLVDYTASYVDYVNVGWKNKDKKTYSFVQYWESSNGVVSFDYDGDDAPLSKDGLFQFGWDTFPCMTKMMEDGIVIIDYRAEDINRTEEMEM